MTEGFSLFPLVIDSTVRQYVLTYLDHFAVLRESFGRSAPYFSEMVRELREQGVPGDFVYLAFAESAFSEEGAGPWQFTTATAQRFGLKVNDYLDQRRDPVKSTRAAAQYLSMLHAQVGDWLLAIVGWNTGEASVERFEGLKGADYHRIAHILPRRTRALLNRFMAMDFIARHVSGLGLKQTKLAEATYQRVNVKGGTPLQEVAAAANTTVEMIRALNPALLVDMAPPDEASYELLIPKVEGAARIAAGVF